MNTVWNTTRVPDGAVGSSGVVCQESVVKLELDTGDSAIVRSSSGDGDRRIASYRAQSLRRGDVDVGRDEVGRRWDDDGNRNERAHRRLRLGLAILNSRV